MASEIIESDKLHLFLPSDGTRIDDNEYLETLENGTELIILTEEQIQKLSVYFKITLMKNFEELKAVLSSTSTPVQSVFIVFPYDFEQAKHIQ